MASVWVVLLICLSVYESAADAKNNTQNESNKAQKVCMKDLGCFELNDDYKDRFINVLPQDRRLINTQFNLFTRNNPKETHILIGNKPMTLIHSPFDASLPTKFIVHGFLDNEFFATWQRDMKDELMEHAEYNVVIVDWSGGNQLPYSQATANTRVVGAEIAFLINQMQKYVDLNLKTCHIIGHSLGAHVAGYAGERLNKLNRITALDPANPLFNGLPPSVRIDPSDAEFVDAIHTDSASNLSFGMRQSVGHVDFFPNDGKEQPGCEAFNRILSLITDGLIDGIRTFAGCNHQRAVEFFQSSINSKTCNHIGYLCSNWSDFIGGKCFHCGQDKSKCATMGINADQFKVKNQNSSVQVFLKTNDKSPFCVHHYRVTIGLSVENEKSMKGKLKIAVPDKTGNKIMRDLNERYENLIPGNRLTFLLTTPLKLNLKNPIDIKWSSDSLFSFYKLNIENIEILPMNCEDEKMQIKHRTVYYQKTERPIREQEAVQMYPVGKQRAIITL